MANTVARDQSRFVRRTTLSPEEYRVNFRQIDCEVIEALTSPEAEQVTSRMSKIYLRLTNAPQRFWEREGVLRFIGEEREGNWETAWQQLVEMVGVASATARKALDWMSKQGIIGYFAGRNGVGIRIFINRAFSSIRRKPDQGQKNLRLVRTSRDESRTSSLEVPFKGSFAILENLDSDLIPPAPESGAADKEVPKKLSDPNQTPPEIRVAPPRPLSAECNEDHCSTVINSNTIVERIVREVVPQVKAAATLEHERTREWFINHALPKAIRVAQASAYDVLRAHGQINKVRPRSGNDHSRPDSRPVGKHTQTQASPRLLSEEVVNELAEACVALLVTQGQTIDISLSEMSFEAGGFLLREDVPKIRAKAEALAYSREGKQISKGGNNDH